MATVHGKAFGWLAIAALALIGAAAILWSNPWLAWSRHLLPQSAATAADDDHHAAGEEHGDHAAHADEKGKGETETHEPGEESHEHGGKPHYDHAHDDAAAITLSQQAKGTIGLRVARVELATFERTITVPGMVVERPGRSILQVTAPLTGVVTRIFPIQGEAVAAPQPLFEVRLTHEELVQAQGEFLRTAEELDVIRREVSRLEKVTAEGAIAGKTLLDRKYEQQKQEAALRAQRQALMLHGLSPEQVDGILTTRTLLGRLTVAVPAGEDLCQPGSPARLLQVQELRVAPGQHVNAGDTLCVLADHRELYLEGRAFEQDIEAIQQAASKDWRLSAALESKAGKTASIKDLKILYLADKVDPESRAFRFYVTLPNRLLREDRQACGPRFVYWQFRPGQRIEIKIPVERWPDRIVLPVEAVAQDGAEQYVFEANGDHFDRRPVRVEYRDQTSVVIANDGALKLGGMVAESAAHQMQLALKNKAGGGGDPHAGHNH